MTEEGLGWGRGCDGGGAGMGEGLRWGRGCDGEG